MSKFKMIESILDKLKISYMKEDEDNEYMCYVKIDEKCSFPFSISVNESGNFILIETLPLSVINDTDINTVLRVINKANADLVYGTFYLEDFKVYYNIGISIEGDKDNITLNSSQIVDYIQYMISSLGELLVTTEGMF